MGGYIGAASVASLVTTSAEIGGDANIEGNLTVQGTTVTIDSANAQTVDLGDNDRIRLGDGDDLELYHNGSASIIKDDGVGDLYVGGDNNILITNAALNETKGKFISNGAVELYHDNSKKFETTATGVDVTGTMFVNGDGTGGRITGDGSGGLDLQDGNGRQTFKIMSPSSGSTQAMTLDASGNLLVGHTSADVDTLVDNNTVGITLKANGEILASSTATVATLERENSDGDLIELRKDGSTVGSIGSVASGANLYMSAASGIGLGMGGDNLYPVNASGSSTDGSLDIGDSSARFRDLHTSRNAMAANFVGTDDTDTFIAMTGSNLQRFFTGGTERMRISSSGTTDFHGRVNVTRNQNSDFVAKFENNAGGGYGISSDNSAGNHIFFYRDGSQKGSITDNGSSTSFNTSSDYRLKENVTDVTDGITRLKQLQPRRFNFIADADATVDGFLAHEAQSVVPEAVTGTKDAVMDEEYEVKAAVTDDDGNVVEEAEMGTRSVPDYQGIDQSKIVPLLTAALQEAIAKIETLETKVAALEG